MITTMAKQRVVALGMNGMLALVLASSPEVLLKGCGGGPPPTAPPPPPPGPTLTCNGSCATPADTDDCAACCGDPTAAGDCCRDYALAVGGSNAALTTCLQFVNQRWPLLSLGPWTAEGERPTSVSGMSVPATKEGWENPLYP